MSSGYMERSSFSLTHTLSRIRRVVITQSVQKIKCWREKTKKRFTPCVLKSTRTICKYLSWTNMKSRFSIAWQENWSKSMNLFLRQAPISLSFARISGTESVMWQMSLAKLGFSMFPVVYWSKKWPKTGKTPLFTWVTETIRVSLGAKTEVITQGLKRRVQVKKSLMQIPQKMRNKSWPPIKLVKSLECSWYGRMSIS